MMIAQRSILSLVDVYLGDELPAEITGAITNSITKAGIEGRYSHRFAILGWGMAPPLSDLGKQRYPSMGKCHTKRKN
jgi:hypothetical protein